MSTSDETLPAAANQPFEILVPAEKQPALRELSAEQWKAGVAAWLGWMFDGLDMHLYTLVAATFVAELLHTPQSDPSVGFYSSWIQAAFLIGWAVGGAFFGIIGDRLGRTRALVLTVLVYAAFTGLSYFAMTWWHLLIFRFVAALGIGGEWAVGASLIAETWPRRWRPWLAAILQTAVNCGILFASVGVNLLAGFPPRTVFLIGIIPALFVLWVRRAVPDTEEWQHARDTHGSSTRGFHELFAAPLRRTTLLVLAVCGLSLTGHWAFMFWCSQHLRKLPDVVTASSSQQNQLVSQAMMVVMLASIAGNFLAAAIAHRIGYRRTIVYSCIAYFGVMFGAYIIPRPYSQLWWWLIAIGMCSGLFALFTMYLPPLFPTLLRTTGAGFCYNFGRIAAALGTVFFGLVNKVGDYRTALLYAGLLFLPAALVAWFLPDTSDTSRLLEPSPHDDELAPG